MGNTKRILAVDDEYNNLVVLKALLTSMGHQVEPASDGARALARIGPDIDLVLLDIMMPKMDGLEVARRIRNTPDVADIPIIMVTALSGKDDRLRAVEAGANDFISKPVDKVELHIRMDSLLKMKEARDALKNHKAMLEKEVERRTEELVTSLRERAVIRQIFGTYISDEVVAEILSNPDGINLGGEIREVTILVCDLRGFSPIADSMDCRKVLGMMNRYFEAMTEIIIAHEGTIDSFLGDGVLVFFGAPRFFADHPGRAVHCAIEMQHAMVGLNADNVQFGLPELRMGIGINSGELIVGNIGCEKRKQYGAVGTPINAAFRVESKTRPGEILITQAVKERLGDEFVLGSSWKDGLKGIGDVMLYQILT
ncbi:MAG: response regulator [Pseudomonadota bacterium]